MTDSAQYRKPTVEEDIRELYSRVAKLSDRVMSLEDPTWTGTKITEAPAPDGTDLSEVHPCAAVVGTHDHQACETCDLTDPCPCCGLRFAGVRWVNADGTPYTAGPRPLPPYPIGTPADPGLRDAEAQQLRAELAALRQVSRGYCPECGRGDCAPTVADWEAQRRRADQAEAEVARLRTELAEADEESRRQAEHDDATCEAVQRRDIAEAAVARVRRFCEPTADSYRVYAAQTARDVLQLLAGPDAAGIRVAFPRDWTPAQVQAWLAAWDQQQDAVDGQEADRA